jgi:hypothetical protein
MKSSIGQQTPYLKKVAKFQDLQMKQQGANKNSSWRGKAPHIPTRKRHAIYIAIYTTHKQD